jgi:hypothetical protein
MKSNQEGKGRQTMKLTIGVLGMVLALTSAGASMSAQTEATTDKASGATQETAPKTYRLTYAITHLEGAKQLGVQHFALTVIPDSRGYTDSQIRLGSRVPIATGGQSDHGASAPGQVQYQYVDVGLNISAHVKEFPTGVLVYSKVEQSSLADEPSGVGSSDPVIRQGLLLNTALLTLGKPVMLGSLDVPGSTHHMDIEVMLEIVK